MKKVDINVSLVRRLVAAQFPQWVDLEIRPVEIDGHDNRTFRLGDEMSVRLPSHKRYSKHVSTEQEWLPKLAKGLPLPIPEPIGKGKPTQEYPWLWSVNKWLPGKNASSEIISDLSNFANDLADFLNALQAIDATNAPQPGQDNFFRGGELSVYDIETRECIDALRDVIDACAATLTWESALNATWDHPPVWIHGDVAVENLLVQDGKLCAVIDFGQLAAGDPSCDTTIAWTLFSKLSRKTFKIKLNVEETTWVRGRGWGLWKALLSLRKYRGNNPEKEAEAKCVIMDILEE
jgi:aminoglycoside phosphotransferase (APT) family kinase protein